MPISVNLRLKALVYLAFTYFLFFPCILWDLAFRQHLDASYANSYFFFSILLIVSVLRAC